jgi:hypothetical protein
LFALGVSSLEADSDHSERAAYVIWEWCDFLAAPCHFHVTQLGVVSFDARIRDNCGLGRSIDDCSVSRQWVAIFGHVILVGCFRSFFSYFSPEVCDSLAWACKAISCFSNLHA